MSPHVIKYPHARLKKLHLLTTAVSLALAGSINTVSAQQDDTVEEVIVTGSYIRRSEGFAEASPVTTFSAEDIEAQGTINMAQVVQNLTFNNGTGVTNSIQGTTNQIASFNLRGLGDRATLTLVDGKRVVDSNVQLLLPTMAIQNMDIVTDGAATIYGTDAVAGVVNLVPYKSYDGFKVELYQEGDDRGDYHKTETSFLGGTSFGSVDVVVAGSFQKNDTLRWMDRPEYVRAGLTHNSGSNPGNFMVPQRDANGDLTGSTSLRPDPACGTDQSDNQAEIGNSAWGTYVPALGRCWLSFGDTRDFMEAIDSSNLYGNLNWEYSDDLSFNAQFMWNRQIVRGRENPGNPGFRENDLPTVRGELPGNTFRATTSGGTPLFAVPLRDAGGNIVLDGYGRPLPYRDGNGQVVLADDRFASIDNDPLGGIPFYEDVRLTAWLPFGKQGIPNTLPTTMQKNNGLNMEKDDKRTFRGSFGADFTVPVIDGWEGTAFYTYSRMHQGDIAQQDFSYSAVEQGLNCDVINDVDSCFNPFAAVDPRFRNSQQVADAIYTLYPEDNTNYLQTFDVILNGDIPIEFELPGGPIAMAVGYQRREEQNDSIPPLGDILNDSLIGNQELPQSDSRSSDSWFAEFGFPILENLQVSASVRDESFSTGQGKVISKYGLTYAPVDWLNLRATSGEAFIVPTLNQLNRPEQCVLSNFDDPFTTAQGFITSCITGNPDLSSETSDSLSFGFDLTLFDELVWSLTWSETDFKDRIVSTTTQDIARSDFRNFRAATGFTPTDAQPEPTAAQLQAWLDSGLADPRIIRNNTLEPVRLLQSDSNASSMLVRAFDTSVSYGFSLDDVGLNGWGDINLLLQATYVDTYTFQLSADAPEREAVGNQNNDYGAVPAIPELRANLRINWMLGNHSVSATARYVDEVTFDASEFSFQRFFPGSTWKHTDVIRAWSQLDAYYTYRDFEALGGVMNFSVGARNLFDRMPQKVGMIAGVEASLQDPLGRVIYARVNYNF
ncbi:MAG: TonB-dependent receptor [Gammaproteobacteria bacterium]|nr:TonB-dependent receptor [Pseudomonadales bacterium]MCP5345707.1 TonB-dependent receptor [Pseudomonadales bacterium]